MNRMKLEELKFVEVEILKEFVRICETLRLNYYVLGGTLLGAVRHKGFIPWDDDIDVGMLRKDYEVFIAEAQKLLPEHLFLQTFRTDPDWPGNFAKIRNSNTTFIETSVRNCRINHGAYIDIFPLDFYPSKHVWGFERIKMLLNLRISTAFYGIDISTRGRFLRGLLCVLLPSRAKTVMVREKLYTSIRPTHMIANYCGAWGQKEIVPAEWYAEGCELEFEGMAVNGPKEYDKWLTQVYGNYMEFPPEEKRVAHHYADVIDLHTPYTEYRRKARLE